MSVVRIKSKYEVAEPSSEQAARLRNPFNIIPTRLQRDENDKAMIYIDEDDGIAAYAMLCCAASIERVPGPDMLRDDLSLSVFTTIPVEFARVFGEGQNGFSHGHHINDAIAATKASGVNAIIHPSQNPYRKGIFKNYIVPSGSSTTIRLHREPDARYYVHVGVLLDNDNLGGALVLHQHYVTPGKPQKPQWFDVVEGEVFYLGIIAFGGDLGLYTKWMPPEKVELFADATGAGDGRFNEFFEKLFKDLQPIIVR